MDWLNSYAFPTEKSFKDPLFARRVYTTVVRDTLRNGTTTALYYGTIHLEASKIFADVVEQSGQRGYIGKVCMDRNAPSDYIETTSDSIKNTSSFIEYVLAKNNPLVQPVITPRFIPTCTPELMKGLSVLASEHHLVIQSHISESMDQVKFTKALHPNWGNGRDVVIFGDVGLLTERTVMAHGTQLTDQELEVLSKKKVGIAHCPLSNIFFGGVFPVKKSLNNGVKVGLGTDVAGGYSCSLLSSIRNTVISSKVVEMTTDASNFVDHKEAFWLATMGGASLLGISGKIGSFAVGKAFDALLVDYAFDLNRNEKLDDRFWRFINLGDDRNIRQVYVQGKCVVDTLTKAKL